MNNTINPIDEMRLTRAINDAATRASADSSKDRNQLLAQSMLDNRVDTRFAKAASAAFNKQLSVLTFQHATDSNRADSFQLADCDKVLEHMGAQQTQDKTASVAQKSEPFVIRTAPKMASMKKTASEHKVVKPNFEDTVSKEKFKLHVLSMMDKHAAAHNRLIGELDNLKAKVEHDRQELAKELQKTASFAFHTACNIFGEEFKNAMQELLPEKDFTKTANVVATPTPLNIKIAKLLYDIESRDLLNDAIAEYQQGLLEFCKTAADDDGDAPTVPATLTGGVIAAAPVLLKGVGGLVADAQDRLTDTLTTGYGNASKLRDTRDVSVAPASVLNADFLLRDRMRDRMLGWSDMSADKNFAQYPAEEVFLATQRAMDLDSNLERRDRREYLRALVGKLLTQRNRLGEADVAAWANVEQSLGRRDTARERVLAQISAMAPKDAPQRPELASLLSSMPTKLKEYDAAGKIEEISKAVKKDIDKRLSEKKKERKETDAKTDNDRKAFLSHLNSIGLHLNPADPTHLYTKDRHNILHLYRGPAGSLRPPTVDEMLENYKQQLATIH